MGKMPFPGFKSVQGRDQSGAKHELKTMYNHKEPWMGYSPILQYMTPGELNWRGVINMNPNLQVSDGFKVDLRTAKALEEFEFNPNLPRPVVDNTSGIHPIWKRENWLNIPDFLYE